MVYLVFMGCYFFLYFFLKASQESLVFYGGGAGCGAGSSAGPDSHDNAMG
jgi:hypothetical protein